GAPLVQPPARNPSRGHDKEPALPSSPSSSQLATSPFTKPSSKRPVCAPVIAMAELLRSQIKGTTLARAKAEDVPDIKKMVTAAYSKYVERMGKPPAPMVADYDQLLQTCDIFVLRTDEADKHVGSIVLSVESDSDAVQINNLVVDPAAQGRGFGRALIGCAEDLARAKGRTALTLYTNVKMYENFGLYAKMGFEEIDRRTEAGYQRVYFRKELAQ
ncbi:hypothetical protein TOPH_08610, partial [Tolypocladium ophioglossoides CBS 100239]